MGINNRRADGLVDKPCDDKLDLNSDHVPIQRIRFKKPT